MASRDGIGAPRKPSTLERETAILEEAKRLQKHENRGLRYIDAIDACRRAQTSDDFVPTRNQINYSLQRLAAAGKIERRDGYMWHLK